MDLELYDKATQALLPLPLADCSLMVLNHTRPGTASDNGQSCRDFAEALAAKNLRVTRHVMVDCQNPSMAAREILDWLVDYLVERVEDLDRAYLAATTEELSRLQQALHAELDRATEALGDGRSHTVESKVFRPLFHTFWEDLTGKLEGLLKELQQQRDKQCAELRQAVQAAQTAAEKVVLPTAHEIERRAHAAGSLDKAYYGCMNECRASLAQHFLALDQGLKQGIERVKERVASELARTILGCLKPAGGTQLLSRLRQEASRHGQRLELAIDSLLSFDLAYRGLIQHRIRKHLDVLTPDLTPLKLPQRPNAAQARSGLETGYREAIYGISQTLQEILIEPSQAAFALVEELLDAVLRAEGAKDEWYFLMDELRADLWKADFDALGERSRRRQQWLAGVDRARQAANLESFRVGPE